MAKGIFTTKINSNYDDLPEIHYHFPKTYLNQVRANVGDWIIYYEPSRQDTRSSRRNGRQAYFATARIQHIEADPHLADHYYAFVTNFLEFDHVVPFREGGKYLESALKKEDGSTNKGLFGRAVRLIPENEYQLIVQLGFMQDIVKPRDYDEDISAEEEEEYSRPIVDQLISRPFRDTAFAKNIRTVYNDSCAMTGLKLINGGGHCEVEAAHIQPVGSSHHGPDSVRNGIALSRSIHWMFDRGMLSLTDEYQILIAEKLVPDPIKRLFNPNGQAWVSTDTKLRPHPRYLRYHREHIFKG